MRAELPWNVAGIPPEAREAARTAARREGLSVGEWLTRRILRSFSGMGEELAPMAYENRASTGASLDSGGLPLPTASHRGTEEVIARVGRSENESNEAWQRIEDQLRGLSRRLDSSERTDGESNRVLSRTAQEMNIAAREQTQAFDQLGQTVMALQERLERLERSATHDGIKEAVKALHQGLSRLADQITTTANNSASQVVQLTSNLEQLAERVGQARLESEEANRTLDARIDDTARSVGSRLEAIDRWLDKRFSSVDLQFSSVDTRLSSVEKTAQFNTNALDHALEKIEAAANQRAADQVENRKRAGQQEETLHRLEDSIARLEMRLPDAGFERRLDGIEHSVSGMAGLLEEYGPADKIHAALQAISCRLDAMEKDYSDILADLRTEPPRPTEPPQAFEPPRSVEPAHFTEPSYAFEPPRSVEPPQSTEPPHAFGPALLQASEIQAETAAEPQAEMQTQPLAEPEAIEPLPHAELSPHEEHSPQVESSPQLETAAEPAFQCDHAGEATDAFAEPGTSHGFVFDAPSESSDAFASPPEFEEHFADVPQPENFLAQARRSAREASEKAESESRSRLGAFRWGKDTDSLGQEKTRPRYLLPALVAMLVVVAAAAALILSHRARQSEVAALPVPRPATATGPTYSVPSPSHSSDRQFVVAPQAGNQPGSEKNFDTQRSEPAGQDNLPPAATPPKQNDMRNAPVNPGAQTAKPASTAPATDKVAQLASAGNPTALTILGLRDLDGTNGAAVNLRDAFKFLSEAAEKGQAVAQYRLGTIYERGQGVTADPAKAAHWYEMAANQGNRKAMHNLAVSYASGAAGKQNMAEAARWFAKAAALGLSDSQFNLAVLYERGDGVPQSLLDAYKWYSIAAATGDAESKQRMGVLQTQLSDTDKAAANKSAATFRATPLNRSANVPPEPADLGT